MSAELTVRDEGPARVLVLSNPPRKGAVDAAVLARIAEECARAGDGVRAVVLTGVGSDFCSGYDLSSLPKELAPGELPDAVLGAACAAIEACPAPVVAAIGGPAFGAGCELAAACDFRICAPAARFSLPPARLGLVYAAEGAWRIVRLIGLQEARQLFLRANQIPASHAEKIGLVDSLADDPLHVALKLALDLEQLAPLSIAGMKRTLLALCSAPLDAATRAELEALRRQAFASADASEGRAAFLERRAARWTGR